MKNNSVQRSVSKKRTFSVDARPWLYDVGVMVFRLQPLILSHALGIFHLCIHVYQTEYLGIPFKLFILEWYRNSPFRLTDLVNSTQY